MSEPQQYKPGDVVNGHVLTSDGRWIPAGPPPVPGAPGPGGPGPGGPGPGGPGYGAPDAKPKKPIYLRWWFIAIAVFVLLGVIGSLTGGDSTEPTSAVDEPVASAPAEEPDEPAAEESKDAEEPTADETKEPKAKESKAPAPAPEKEFDVAVRAGKLIDDFSENELAADRRYKGKTLKVAGVVDNIDTDLFDEDKYILGLTDGSDFAFLTVRVHDIPQKELLKLKVGQKVTIIGEFDDGGSLGVDLKDGRIL